MKVLFVSVEASPFAKVGGLADVAGSLPRALRALGHDARTLMPDYKLIGSPPGVTEAIPSFKVDLNAWWHKRATLRTATHAGVPYYFLGTDEWFNEVDRSERIYAPGVDAYLFFARATLEALLKLDWIPDVIHCNDWHTGFLPALMREQYAAAFTQTGTVFTIHNLAYQGEFGPETLSKVGLPAELFNFHQMEAFGSVNFLKTGGVFSDQTNTVSETYAQEIQTPEFGCRLDGFMRHLAEQGRLSGIVNGIDTDEWNPATDLRLAANYDADHPADKSKCRDALYKALKWEPIEGAPVAGIVSRLSSQKGMDLLLNCAEKLFDSNIQLVVQGLGDQWLADEFRKLETKFPKHFRFAQRFDVELAQHVYSGSDIFLMPSAFEPCGLGQLIAMRYGSIPVVRRTGGLADTVHDGENGFVFEPKTPEALLEATLRAKAAYDDKATWSQLLDRAMRRDSGWATSAARYEQLYLKSILSRRSDAA